MRGACRFIIAWACTIGLTPSPARADNRPTPPSSAVAPAAQQAGPAIAARRPDLSVASVWLGKGTATHTDERFEPLGRSPWVGEKVSLVCDVRMSDSAPSGWSIAWFIDGQVTCGEGDFMIHTPSCEFSWSLSGGTTVFIDYVAHTPGSHKYRCAVDIHDAVHESSESNNAKQISFTVNQPVQPIPRLVSPQIPGPGPQFRRLR